MRESVTPQSAPQNAPRGPALAVSGFSGSGKTTLLERVIPVLASRGLSVCALKHDAHGVRYDPEGKDSDRLFQAGADVTLRGPGEALVRKRRDAAEGDAELYGLLASLLGEYDVVLVEGHKGTPLPKVWLCAEGESAAPNGVTGVLHTLPRDVDRASAFLALLDTWLPRAWREPPLLAGVLIGGASRRMGSPKQLLTWEGRSLIERTVEVLSSAAQQVVLLGGGDVPESCAHLARIPDPPGLAGPLAGILGAMRWAPTATWIVAACDHPRISHASIAWLLEERVPGKWSVLPRTAGDHVEPLLAIYERHARNLLESLAAAGRLAPSALATHQRTHMPSPPAALVEAWSSVNTPEELAELERRREPDRSGEPGRNRDLEP